MSAASRAYLPALRQWQRRAYLVGGIAGVICLIGAIFFPDQFYRAYLSAYLFWLGVCLGSLALVMLYHLTGGAWGYLIRRILKAQMSTLPLLAVLFVPLGFGLKNLYLWARPDIVEEYEAIRHSQFYFNETFFLLRVPAYFAVWLLFVFLLKRLTARQAQTGDPALPWRFQRTSEIGLVLFGTILHFAAFDWIQSLQPHFHSSIFPLLIAATALLSAQLFAVLVLGILTARFRAVEEVSTGGLIDLGNLMLTFLIITSYLMWFQYMLIWIANLPYGSMWFLPRTQGGWHVVILILVGLEFAVPLFLLFMRPIKSDPKRLASLAGWMLLMQLLLNYWLVMPVFPSSSILEHWLDLITPLAIGGLSLGWFLGHLTKQELVVPNDRNRKRALELCEVDRETLERKEALAHG